MQVLQLTACLAAMSRLDLLPIDVLARVLALASQPPDDSSLRPRILPRAVGQLMLLCKRCADAVHSAAFWQNCFVFSETTALYDPRHAAWITLLVLRLINPRANLGHHLQLGRFCYQPWLPRLTELQVRPGLPPDLLTMRRKHATGSSTQAYRLYHSAARMQHDQPCTVSSPACE